MYYWTADEHFGHNNIIKYVNRPFTNIHEMNEELIERFNSKVTKDDITIHAGDFALVNKRNEVAKKFIDRLNGKHTFLWGSHDYWQKPRNYYHEIHEVKIDGIWIVTSHYQMTSWRASQYNSWHLYAHAHGQSESVGKSMDVGVDPNNFYPISFDEIKVIMNSKPDNPNLIPQKERRY